MDVERAISVELDRIEQDEEVVVFYACESGSRAWGFESQDSDYDVRFLYLHPMAWYLTIGERRDVIEKPVEGDLDLSGWDLRKALSLFRKSNPPLLEWLQSPTVYRERFSIRQRIVELMPEYYSPRSCLYHYLHMAQGNFRQYLKGGTVWVKKYFYVLRPILACRWIEAGLGVVPMEFQKLVDGTLDDPALLDGIANLLARKRAGHELDSGPRIPVISRFLEHELERLSGENPAPPAVSSDPARLDQLFRDALAEVWGSSI